MVDPHRPLLAEIRALRAQFGSDDPDDWRIWRYPLSPCLTSMVVVHEEETVMVPDDALSVFDLLIQLEHLSTAPPDPDRLRAAPFLDMWSVRRMDDGCLHLIGEVSGHANLADGVGIFTEPYLRLDQARGWARTCNAYYRLGRHDRQRDDFNRAFYDARGTVSPDLDLEN